jgi:ParE toxin of type II toxin-antitoxin system, parDE
MKISLHPEVLKDISEAVQFYEEQQAGLGANFAAETEAAIYRLADFPNLNPEISKRIRRAIVPVFPYGIMYIIQGEYIVVYAVAHLHRKPFYWKNRTR